MLQNNNNSFRILTQNKPPAPMKWFALTLVNLFVIGVWFQFFMKSAWTDQSNQFVGIVGYILGAALVVFLLALLVDLKRSFFK